MSSSTRCLTCRYNKPLSGTNSGYKGISKKELAERYRFCDYIGITSKRRPCAGGDECTVYEKKTRGAKRI